MEEVPDPIGMTGSPAASAASVSEAAKPQHAAENDWIDEPSHCSSWWVAVRDGVAPVSAATERRSEEQGQQRESGLIDL